MAKKIKAEEVSKKKSAENQIFEQDGELVVDVYETGSDFVVLAAIAFAHSIVSKKEGRMNLSAAA